MKTQMRMAHYLTTLLILTACATQAPALPTAVTASTPVDGGTNLPASGLHHMTDAPFDAMFLDGMIVHHEGAITMAKQALTEAQRTEIRQLAEAIIATQQAEIEQMQRWRADWLR